MLMLLKHLINRLNSKTKIVPEKCLTVGNNLIEDAAAKKIVMEIVILAKSINKQKHEKN